MSQSVKISHGEVMQTLQKHCTEAYNIFDAKSAEYCKDHNDRFQQIRIMAEMNQLTQEQIIRVLMSKHEVAIAQNPSMELSSLMDKLLDLIVYNGFLVVLVLNRPKTGELKPMGACMETHTERSSGM